MTQPNRCTETSRKHGRPCRGRALPGKSVCSQHDPELAEQRHQAGLKNQATRRLLRGRAQSREHPAGSTSTKPAARPIPAPGATSASTSPLQRPDPSCVHHYVIDAAGLGTCRACGGQRQHEVRWKGDEGKWQ